MPLTTTPSRKMWSPEMRAVAPDRSMVSVSTVASGVLDTMIVLVTFVSSPLWFLASMVMVCGPLLSSLVWKAVAKPECSGS